MVRIKGTDGKINHIINIAPYVPLDIKLGEWDEISDGTVYCRFGDFKKSLVELGVARSNCKVRSITLVEAEDISLDYDIQVGFSKTQRIFKRNI